MIYRIRSCTITTVAAIFNLHENQHFILLCYNINFSIGGIIITFYNAISLLFQIIRCKLLIF